MEDAKRIQGVMVVESVEKTHVTSKNRPLSTAVLTGDNGTGCRLVAIDEFAARVLAGRIFGKVRVTIEIIDEET